MFPCRLTTVWFRAKPDHVGNHRPSTDVIPRDSHGGVHESSQIGRHLVSSFRSHRPGQWRCVVVHSDGPSRTGGDVGGIVLVPRSPACWSAAAIDDPGAVRDETFGNQRPSQAGVTCRTECRRPQPGSMRRRGPPFWATRLACAPRRSARVLPAFVSSRGQPSSWCHGVVDVSSERGVRCFPKRLGDRQCRKPLNVGMAPEGSRSRALKSNPNVAFFDAKAAADTATLRPWVWLRSGLVDGSSHGAEQAATRPREVHSPPRTGRGSSAAGAGSAGTVSRAAGFRPHWAVASSLPDSRGLSTEIPTGVHRISGVILLFSPAGRYEDGRRWCDAVVMLNSGASEASSSTTLSRKDKGGVRSWELAVQGVVSGDLVAPPQAAETTPRTKSGWRCQRRRKRPRRDAPVREFSLRRPPGSFRAVIQRRGSAMPTTGRRRGGPCRLRSAERRDREAAE
jgi:hypothetical protein